MLPPFCILLLHASQALSREFSKRILQLTVRQRIDRLLADEPPAQRLLDGLSDVPLVHPASFEQIQNCPQWTRHFHAVRVLHVALVEICPVQHQDFRDLTISSELLWYRLV